MAVDGRVEREPGRRVDPARQRLSVDGAALRSDPERLVYAFHKPEGLITSRRDPAGRRTIYDRLGPGLPWLFPVGRLDRDSSGLLVLTNDHALAHRLTHPSSHLPKTYHVRVAGIPEEWALQRLREGVDLDGDGCTRPARARLLGVVRGGESWLELALTEGRKRQVRRMCAAVGHPVRALVRVGIGDLPLGALPAGELRRLSAPEVRLLARG